MHNVIFNQWRQHSGGSTKDFFWRSIVDSPCLWIAHKIFSNFRGSLVYHKSIFDLQLWTTHTGASLILEKLFSRSSSYDIACFSILANGPHLDATIISENIFRSSSIDGVIFNFWHQIFWKVRNSAYNLRFKLSSFKIFFWMDHKKKLSEDPALGIGPFQKVQREVIYFCS